MTTDYADDTPLTQTMLNELCNYFDPAPVAHLCAYDKPYWWLGETSFSPTLEIEKNYYEIDPGEWEDCLTWTVCGEPIPTILIPKTYGEFILLCKLLKFPPRNHKRVEESK